MIIDEALKLGNPVCHWYDYIHVSVCYFTGIRFDCRFQLFARADPTTSGFPFSLGQRDCTWGLRLVRIEWRGWRPCRLWKTCSLGCPTVSWCLQWTMWPFQPKNWGIGCCKKVLVRQPFRIVSKLWEMSMQLYKTSFCCLSRSSWH